MRSSTNSNGVSAHKLSERRVDFYSTVYIFSSAEKKCVGKKNLSTMVFP